MNKCLIFFLLFQVIVSFSYKGFLNRTKSGISITIDFIPIVGNLIEITETVTGNDYTTYQNKTDTERTLSLQGAKYFRDLLKFAKYIKIGKIFFDVAKRIVNFFKVCARAMKKIFQNIIRDITKLANGLLKQFGMKSNNNTSINTDI